MSGKKIRICRVLIIRCLLFWGWVDLYNGPLESTVSEVYITCNNDQSAYRQAIMKTGC